MNLLTYDVIVLGGRVYCDIIFAGLPHLPVLGEEVFSRKLAVNVGGSANTAIALRRLGLSPGLIAGLGTDFFSEFVYSALNHENLDTRLIQMYNFPTAAVTVALPIDGERAFVSYVEPEELPAYAVEILQPVSARHLHVCGMSTAFRQRHLICTAKEMGWSTSLDCACEHVDLRAPQTGSLLESIDYLIPNAAEALSMTETAKIYEAASVLSEFVPTVVIKVGAEGSIAYSGSRRVESPAIDVEPVDTTGAGDCFAAGFLLGILAGLSLEECLHYGNIAGGLSTLGCGATTAPTYDELMDYLACSGEVIARD